MPRFLLRAESAQLARSQRWPRVAHRRPVLAWAILPAVAAMALTGCEHNSDAGQGKQLGKPEVQLPTNDENDDEGFRQLAISLVAVPGEYTGEETGPEFGCGDQLIEVNSVPYEAETAEDAVTGALNFLLAEGAYRHGDPPLVNAVVFSAETLSVNSIEASDKSVNVDLSGEIVTRSACESERIRAQLQRTAADTAGVQQANITVDGKDLDEVLGLEPLKLR